ncbi:hypothetical protein C943_02924 [Mariniradius saccharolyticus AK6]|uniref:Cytochrome c domain-containing protein n=1 Tax=Mariniradius saccharolyticus AK6 TaxID=1239962 RepID=M7Y2P6_9BACT|nr:VCBS repeat-containing protein [Mariniradius saccharolyticus]EMS35032.1 hypothetical protein C943_02924 [Mariniradius saccharolyticus AK6]
MLFFIRSLFSVCFLIVYLYGCQSAKDKDKEGFELLSQMDQPSLELDGKALAGIYCAACHMFPEPELLDRETWKTGVLPDMRRRLGLINEEDFGVAVGEDNDAPPGIYAASPLITSEIWGKIQDYYLTNAPEKLTEGSVWETEVKQTDLFEVQIPQFPNKRPTLTTLLRFNQKEGKIYLGDRLGSLIRIDAKGFNVLDSIRISSPASDISFSDGGFYLLTMGVMDPSNFSVGNFSFYDQSLKEERILENLTRPVHFSGADLNGDGSEEWLISGFGNHVGQLSMFERTENGYFEKKLNAQPGARKTVVSDLDGDGRLDVLALMTQAKEGVYAYFNRGGGKFSEKKWLEFHPAFGSSDFEFVDMNGDGHLDLVIVNGDNADLSPVEKPYHGVRVFLNDGKYNFSENYFFPMNGASGLVLADFDGNGRLDIAAISYFPKIVDGSRRNFILLLQDKSGKFSPFDFPQVGGLSYLVIEKGDIDADGDVDLLLGSFDFKSTFALPSWQWTPFVWLENKSMK